MTLNFERLLDRTGCHILRLLQENGRISFSELGRQVGLSPPAAAERVRKLEDAGIIAGYQTRISLKKVGLPITAFISLKTPATRYPEVVALANRAPEVLACHHISGDHSFIIQVAVPTVARLESLIGLFSSYGETHTAIVLSSPVVKQVIEPGKT